MVTGKVKALSLIISIFLAHPTAAMATPDIEMHGSDSDSALSESLGPNTLEARSMVPDAYRNTPDAEATRTWV
jgi:hypothetical protein